MKIPPEVRELFVEQFHRVVAIKHVQGVWQIRHITEQVSDIVGPYKLLQQIGEGGMGVVYLAEQTQPVERRVALKIIKPGMDTQQVIARFEAERQALAMMDPSDFWLSFNLAHALEDTNPVEAAGFYWVALAIRPGNYAVYNNLGNALASQQKLPEAIAAYHKAIELDAKFAKAFHNLGAALDSRQKPEPDEAITAYGSAIAILTPVPEPLDADTRQVLRNSHLNRALVYDRLRKHADAVKDWDRAIEFGASAEYRDMRAL